MSNERHRVNNPFSLHGKTVLVTGGAGFLGTHFVNALGAAGAHIVVAEHPDAIDAAQKLAKNIKRKYGVEIQTVEMDVTDQASVDAGFDTLEAVDVVVNNAAIDPKVDTSDPNAVKFEHYPEEAMRESIEVNLLGAWRVSKVAAQKMLQQGQGNIINIASIYGVVPPHPDIYPKGVEKPADYGMTKAALLQLTRHIAALYGKKGIRCNAMVIGGVLKDHDKTFQKEYGTLSMFGRMTKPNEVGAPLVFLASDASKGITGHALAVDGGLTAW